MKIGIAYDTHEMYDLDRDSSQYHDFASAGAISVLKRELEGLGYQVELLGNTENILRLLVGGNFSCDLVYNTVEGIRSRNREGLLPALLETHHIPYIGTDSFGLSLTLNKALTKILAKHLHILTPNFFVAKPKYTNNNLLAELNTLKFPVIIKPNHEGNSTGVCVCHSIECAIEKLKKLIPIYGDILCEEFIQGSEITVPLIGNSTDSMICGVTTVDIQTSEDFWLDVNYKVFGDYKNVLLDTSPDILCQFREISISLFQAVGCCDFARFDYRLTNDSRIYFIEVNPLPSLFRGGSFHVVGDQHGYSFAETLQLIINVACDRLAIPRT